MKIKKLFMIAALAVTVMGAAAGCGSSSKNNNNANTGATNNAGTGTNAGTNAGSNAGNAAAGGGAKAITVKAKNFEFDQPEIRVKQGDKVTITLNNAEGFHGFAIPDYNVDIKENNGTATFTADKAGEHEFHCSVVCGAGHSKMVGKLVVE
ncbi:cupredoxin domain-containing protein [Paenibacillus sp. MMO-177]|uniref:cupredoxin domain-containing protein n=1 Tax=Paenibacillus sp. MMO-177 TaxID=3081289 RepID=UPI0030160F17